jgi:hypothetical protein
LTPPNFWFPPQTKFFEGFPKCVLPFQAILGTFRFFHPMSRGVPRICFHTKSFFFGELKPNAKFRNPTITPSGRKVTQAERKKSKNAVNCSATAHTSRSNQCICTSKDSVTTGSSIMNVIFRIELKHNLKAPSEQNWWQNFTLYRTFWYLLVLININDFVNRLIIRL